MRKIFKCFCLLAVTVCLQENVGADNYWDTLFGKPELQVEWTYQTGTFDGSAGNLCIDKTTGRAFITNSTPGH